MKSETIKAVDFVRKVRDAHYEEFRDKTIQERISTYCLRAKEVQDEIDLLAKQNISTYQEYTMQFDQLYKKAKAAVHPWKLSEEAESGGVGAALLTESGNVYIGVCIDTACSMGFCAEHAAAAAMITARENRVLKMVAVGWDGRIMPPCGRCREFISQLHDDNLTTEVMVGKHRVLLQLHRDSQRLTETHRGRREIHRGFSLFFVRLCAISV